MVRIGIVLIAVILGACQPTPKAAEKNTTATAVVSFDEVTIVPKPAILNDSLSQSFVKVMNQHQDDFVVSEVIITSSDWFTTFNEHGHIESRYRTATAVTVAANNQCYLKDIVVQEKHTKNTFMAPKVVEEKPWKVFNCALLEKRNPDTMAGVNFED